MPHFVSGVFEDLTLWAYLHAGRVCWTDCKADAHGFTADAADQVRAKAPSWLTQVRVGTLMNFRGVSWDVPKSRFAQ